MNIKNPSKSYLRKVVANMKNRLIQFSVELTTQRKEISRHSLWSSFHTRWEKTLHRAGQPAKKRKTHRSTLVSLSFLLFFTSLCIFSLLGRQPLASATATTHLSLTLHHSASNDSSATLHHSALPSLDTTPVDCSNINNASNNSCFGGGDPGSPSTLNHAGELTLGSNQPCNSQKTVSGATWCWENKGLRYGDRDWSCLQDDNAKNELLYFYNEFPALDFTFAADPYSNNSNPSPTPAASPAASPAPAPTPAPTRPPAPIPQGYNQDTCTDASTCYSNNASGEDFIPSNPNGSENPNGKLLIHAYSGGDDITCYNNACLTGNTGAASGCYSGVAYDRFGCSAIEGSPAGEWFYNATAYDPPLMLEHPSAHFRATMDNEELKASGNQPVCQNQQWTCPNEEHVIILSPQDYDVTRGDFTNTEQYNNIPTVFAVFCNSVSGFVFPCPDNPNGSVDQALMQKDWLSGDVGNGVGSGHLVGTLLNDTVSNKNVMAIFSDTLAAGYVLMVPVFILIGYQLLYASWTFRYANILESLPRVLLGITAVSISFELATMLIKIVDVFNIAVVALHSTSSMKYPDVQIDAHHYVYTLDGDNDPASFRGIVIPVTRWGCTLNDFMHILTVKLVSDIASLIPFVGGYIKLATGIADAIDVLRHLGEFMLLILSINLCTQIFVRVILINYYIVTGPIVFGCWAFPAGIGHKVVGQWTRGFLSLLFTQTVQIFVLTTLPLMAPTFPPLPMDRFGLINTLFEQLPRVITLIATVQVPKMMGTGATKAMAQAGNVAAGAVTAIGGIAYNVV